MSLLYLAARPTGTGNPASGPLTIATASVYQVLFGAGTMINGAFIYNPVGNNVPLWVDIANASGGTLAGTSQPIQPGSEWVAPVAFTNAISVYSTQVISFNAGVY